MLNVYVLTPFPDLVQIITKNSILGRAKKKGLVSYRIYNLFDYSDPPHNRIDDYPFGGGKGMILKPEPIFRIIKEIKAVNGENEKYRIIFPTPDGKQYNQKKASKFSKCDNIIFICGHYKGVDQRVRDELVTDEVSIGDYILTGGELPACVITDTIVRLIPGVINNINSAKTDSFYGDLLDHAHYTRPDVFRDLKVPDVLLSGNHKEIDKWKLKNRIEKTKIRRLDLYKKYLKNNNKVE